MSKKPKGPIKAFNAPLTDEQKIVKAKNSDDEWESF